MRNPRPTGRGLPAVRPRRAWTSPAMDAGGRLYAALHGRLHPPARPGIRLSARAGLAWQAAFAYAPIRLAWFLPPSMTRVLSPIEVYLARRYFLTAVPSRAEKDRTQFSRMVPPQQPPSVKLSALRQQSLSTESFPRGRESRLFRALTLSITHIFVAFSRSEGYQSRSTTRFLFARGRISHLRCGRPGSSRDMGNSQALTSARATQSSISPVGSMRLVSRISQGGSETALAALQFGGAAWAGRIPTTTVSLNTGVSRNGRALPRSPFASERRLVTAGARKRSHAASVLPGFGAKTVFAMPPLHPVASHHQRPAAHPPVAPATSSEPRATVFRDASARRERASGPDSPVSLGDALYDQAMRQLATPDLALRMLPGDESVKGPAVDCAAEPSGAMPLPTSTRAMPQTAPAPAPAPALSREEVAQIADRVAQVLERRERFERERRGVY